MTTAIAPVSARDTTGVVLDVLLPLAARGLIVRRPRVVGALDRIDADLRAIRRMQSIRERYAPGPVLLRVPGRGIALIVSGAQVRTVLYGSPAPFATANREKRAALSRFEPHGVLISRGAAREARRDLNEQALDTGRPVHRLGGQLVAKVRQEADLILETARRTGSLTWSDFAPGWWRIVRRIVLGDCARDDELLTDQLAALRADANWAYLKPQRDGLRDRFLDRLQVYVNLAEPGSLVAHMAELPADAAAFPAEQIPQWLFAFDAVAMASFRTLALLDAYPQQARQVRRELAERRDGEPALLAYLRACVLESIRLWPTTPVILRDTTTETRWETGRLPTATTIVVFVPFFHRDEENLAEANRFAPELWLSAPADRDWPLMPFSLGPAECPGRDLVLLTASSLLAALLADAPIQQTAPPIVSGEPLPATLSPFRLAFSVDGAGRSVAPRHR